MAVVITLVGQHHNHLRYLCTADSASTGIITSTGAASPDLLTDTLFGPMRPMAKVVTAGYGQDAGGAQTQDQSRAIWNDDDTGADIGNTNIQRARMTITPREGTGVWLVDADTDGVAPTITVELFGGELADGVAYLDVFVLGAIGQ